MACGLMASGLTAPGMTGPGMTASMDRVVVVSNRLPVTVVQAEKGYQVQPSAGGLVTALRPLLRDSAGVWVGWTGTDRLPEIEQALEEHSRVSNFALKPIFMTAEESARFYNGFSNEVLWPLCHDLQTRCNFDPAYWETHLSIGQRFAEKAAGAARAGDLIWVHDYHLMSVGACLRSLGVEERLAYFHHIPFPGPDIFEKLPWREEILSALLDFDLIGFQTHRDRRNFVACLRHFLRSVQIATEDEMVVVTEPGRSALVGTFPISIDFREFAEGAARPDVAARAEEIASSLSPCRVVLGVDRLDYTKGVPERLAAFGYLLESQPELRGKIALVQVVVPSRESIPEYENLKAQIQRMVSEINGKFGGTSWVPVHYIHRSLERAELLAYYRAADIALITPLKDGMNLVAKEYCAARVNNDGVLILSEFAGAAFQLHQGAMLVNPYHRVAVAEALRTACDMPATEQRKRMRKMRGRVRHEDIFHWRDAFCSRYDRTPVHA